MKGKRDFAASFGTDLVSRGMVVIPEIIIRCYPDLGITELEVMVLINLLRLQQLEGEFLPPPEKLCKNMTVSTETVKATLTSLTEKKLVAVVPCYNGLKGCWESGYSLEGTFEKLSELWACEKAVQIQKGTQRVENDADSVESKMLSALHKIFEKEFGRLLSPMESSTLADWCRIDNISSELVIEALKRAVLRGILNFKYIDSILRDWVKNNVRTVREAVLYEEKFMQRKGKKQGLESDQWEDKSKTKKKRDKYEGVYLS